MNKAMFYDQPKRTKQEDIKNGLKSEKAILPLLKKKFNDDSIVKTTDKYCVYDFEGKHCRIEVKTRTNEYNRYPTTLLGSNKVYNAESFQGEYYFVFVFTDKAYYIKYDAELFDSFDVKDGGRSDRGMQETSKYYFVPIIELQPL
jgi:hypothetical protein